jgi:hypothetical protein
VLSGTSTISVYWGQQRPPHLNHTYCSLLLLFLLILISPLPLPLPTSDRYKAYCSSIAFWVAIYFFIPSQSLWQILLGIEMDTVCTWCNQFSRKFCVTSFKIVTWNISVTHLFISTSCLLIYIPDLEKFPIGNVQCWYVYISSSSDKTNFHTCSSLLLHLSEFHLNIRLNQSKNLMYLSLPEPRTKNKKINWSDNWDFRLVPTVALFRRNIQSLLSLLLYWSPKRRLRK